jgi:hypothetical protein
VKLPLSALPAFTDKGISAGLPLDSADVVTEQSPNRPITVFSGVLPYDRLVERIPAARYNAVTSEISLT